MRRNPESASRVSSRHWLFPAALIALSLGIALAGDDGRQLFRYDRGALADGELWRLLSAHLTHLGWSHFGMNVAGLLLVWALCGRYLSLRGWSLVLAVSALAVDLGMWLLNAMLDWYVGLSGVLHGLLAAGIVTGLRWNRIESLTLGALMLVKLSYEQFGGPLPGSESTAGGPVMVDAHLYGALGGLAVTIPALIRARGVRPL